MLTWIARPITAQPLSLLPAQHSDRTFRDYCLKWLPVAQQNASLYVFVHLLLRNPGRI